MFAIDLDIRDVILEDSGDIDLEPTSQRLPYSKSIKISALVLACDRAHDISNHGADKGELRGFIRGFSRRARSHTSGNVPLEKTLETSQWHVCIFSGTRSYINKQVFPQAPSPTMTSLRRISAMTADGELNKGACDF